MLYVLDALEDAHLRSIDESDDEKFSGRKPGVTTLTSRLEGQRGVKSEEITRSRDHLIRESEERVKI